MNSNELRLFVSSTFRDLQPEREQLIKKVFPRIRKECRERGVEFTEIDLRWGITEEESRSGKTIRICLEEIDRCRPYFIGIIGSRYGWIPGITEIEKDPEMLKEFPWLQEYAENERSIIEMEFAHGAVLQKNDSAFFYEQSKKDLNDSSDFNDKTLEKSFESISSLESLKKNISSTGLPYRKFTNPEQLGEQVFHDILTILDRDFPKKAELTPLERERIEHEAYARNRRQSYVANPEYYDAFVKHVEADGPPLIIWGKSGLGKSALMAYLAHEYQSQNPDAFVIQHFIGAAEGSDPEDVMRQVMMEIKERYDLSDEIPTDDNNVREEFPVWLAKVGANPLLKKEGAGGGTGIDEQPPPNPLLLNEGESDKLVLLIDALNQLTGIAPEMHWLPEFFPPNVRIIVSTTTDSLPLEQLRKRNWNELELGPLTEQQRESISREFLNRFHKSLPPDDLHTLSVDTKSSSPLFLRTVLEELRIFGHHQSLHSQLEDYLTSGDERDLFQKVLARMERDHGAQAVRDVLTAIWASRHGLSESELMEITGMSRMALSELMIAMEYHLMQREGFYTFFHNYLREGIQLRYLGEEELQKGAHSRMGEYFSTREYGNRRRDEEPWQWQEAGDENSLAKTLADASLFMLFADDHHRFEYIKHLLPLGTERATQVIRLVFTSAIDLGPSALVEVVRAMRAGSYFNEAEGLLEMTLPQVQAIYTKAEIRILEVELARSYTESSQFAKAEPVFNEVIAETEESDPALFELLTDISAVNYGLGKYVEAERNIRRALALECDVTVQNRIGAIENLSAFVSAQGKHDEALQVIEGAMDLSVCSFGVMNPTTFLVRLNQGSLLFLSGKAAEAVDVFEKLILDIQSTLGVSHDWYMRSKSSIVNAYIILRNYEMAEKHCLQLIELNENFKDPNHPQALMDRISLGFLYRKMGDIEQAIAIYSENLPLLRMQLGAEHPDVKRREQTLEEMLAERR